MPLTIVRFQPRGATASAFERGMLVAAVMAGIVTADLSVGSNDVIPAPASAPSCDVICDGQSPTQP
jgi:hypothetical protein